MKAVLSENGDPGLNYSFHASHGCVLRDHTPPIFPSRTPSRSRPLLTLISLFHSFLPVLSCRAKSCDTFASCPHTASSPATWCINFVSIYMLPVTHLILPTILPSYTVPILAIPWPSFGHIEKQIIVTRRQSIVLVLVPRPLRPASTKDGNRPSIHFTSQPFEKSGPAVSLTPYTVIGRRRRRPRRVGAIHVLLMGSFQSLRRNGLPPP
ncbi:hypothetical protein LX36DRAFT_290478 [Colletotrichum falcatum]|nr:hypothetical protein LX36DRAFT_290478 [Colletotrichum falcatum]